MTNVLDNGSITLIDHMGTDKTVVNAARISIEGGKRKKETTHEEDIKLIQYLIKNNHMSTLEHCYITIAVRAPITVARQWFRHKSQSPNEVSGRYSTTIFDSIYTPSVERMMTETTKDSRQGAGKITDFKIAKILNNKIIAFNNAALKFYNELIKAGCSKELARGILPLHTYTEFYMTMNLRSLIHFLNARLKQDAQWEIREYAKELLKIVTPLFPETIKICKELYKWD